MRIAFFFPVETLMMLNKIFLRNNWPEGQSKGSRFTRELGMVCIVNEITTPIHRIKSLNIRASHTL